MAEDPDDDLRFDRLITALESQANAVNRLVQVLEHKTKRSTRPRAARLRQPALDKPIMVTPLVQAAVKRALAKARG